MIDFISHELDFKLDAQELVKDWLLFLVKQEEKQIGQLTYIFVSDAYLLQLNQEFLSHDYFTDILTFPYESDPIVSDIYISIDRVRENAQRLDLSFQEELHRVIAHGLLHLFGYDDHGEENQRIMRAKEDEALAMRKS